MFINIYNHYNYSVHCNLRNKMTIIYEEICINRQTKHGHLVSKISISNNNTIPEQVFSHPNVTIKPIWHIHHNNDQLDKNEFCYYDLHHCNISDELINELNLFRKEMEKIRIACYHINELKKELNEAYKFSKKINDICNYKQSPLDKLSYQELKQKKEYDLAFNEGGDGFNPYRDYLEENFHEPIPMNKDLETKPDY